MGNVIIVLAMHGAPPTDFPAQDAAELFMLHGRLGHARGPEQKALQKRHDQLDVGMRAWPRRADNDPFYAGSQELADQLRQATGQDVIVGFNEFCAPDLDTALDQAAGLAPQKIIVVTPMMTRGGDHSEKDIPESVEQARQRHPGCEIVYAWPFDAGEIASFLAGQIERFAEGGWRATSAVETITRT